MNISLNKHVKLYNFVMNAESMGHLYRSGCSGGSQPKRTTDMTTDRSSSGIIETFLYLLTKQRGKVRLLRDGCA